MLKFNAFEWIRNGLEIQAIFHFIPAKSNIQTPL